MKNVHLIRSLVLWLFFTISITNFSQSWRKIQVFNHTEPCTNDLRSGGPTSISNGITIIGNSRGSCDVNGQNVVLGAGVAYFHELQSSGLWIEKQKIVASDREEDDSFGFSVTIDNVIAVIGAPGKNKIDPGSGNTLLAVGAVYVFTNVPNGIWSQQQKLMASDGVMLNGFGFSVSVKGDYVFVGAPGQGDSPSQGKVYVYKKMSSGNWDEVQILTQAGIGNNMNFGWSVSASDDFLFIGAPLKIGYGNLDYSTFVFKKGHDGLWVYFQTIIPPTESQGAFGRNISVNDNSTLIGDVSANGLGAGFLYEYNINTGWYLETQFENTNTNIQGFGNCVSLSNSHAVIGNQTTPSVPVFVYKKDSDGNWLQNPDMVLGDELALDFFGEVVCLTDDYLFIKGGNYGSNPFGWDEIDHMFVFRLCDELIANAGQGRRICKGQTVTLGGDSQNPTAQGGIPPYTYSWCTIPPSTWNSYVEKPVVQPSQTTTYRLTVTDFGGNGITATSDVTIDVNENCPCIYPITFDKNLDEPSLSTNAEGSVVLTGEYYDNSIKFGNDNYGFTTINDINPLSYERIFIGKFTDKGIMQWAHSLSSEWINGAGSKYKKIILDDENNTFLVLQSYHQFFLEDGQVYSGSYSNNNICIIKFNAMGIIEWVRIFERPITGLKNPEISCSDDAVYFKARQSETSTTFFGFPVHFGLFVAKISKSGNVEWIIQNSNWPWGLNCSTTCAYNYLFVYHMDGITIVDQSGTILNECSIDQSLASDLYYFEYGGQDMFYVLSKIQACNGFYGESCSLTGLKISSPPPGNITFSTTQCVLGSCTWPSFASENNYAYIFYEGQEYGSLFNAIRKYEMESGTNPPPIWYNTYSTNDMFSLASNNNQTFGYAFQFYVSNSTSILNQFDKSSGDFGCFGKKALKDALNIPKQLVSNWTIYPNPANDFLKISYSGIDLTNQVQFEIYNSTCTLVCSVKKNDFRDTETNINICSFPCGIYILRIISNGILIKSEKFIKT